MERLEKRFELNEITAKQFSEFLKYIRMKETPQNRKASKMKIYVRILKNVIEKGLKYPKT
jgi:hypothetical protein